jgi:hypothetical protein
MDHSNVADKVLGDEPTGLTGTHGNPGSWTWDVELNGKELVPQGYLRSLQLDSLRPQPERSPAMLKSRAISLFPLTADPASARPSPLSTLP